MRPARVGARRSPDRPAVGEPGFHQAGPRAERPRRPKPCQDCTIRVSCDPPGRDGRRNGLRWRRTVKGWVQVGGSGRHQEVSRSGQVGGFRSVFAESEFRWLWAAGVQSQLGDQLARVALSVMVFERTASTLLTATVYALTFLPAFLGALLLGGLADRYPRRRVLVCCDLVRAGLLAAMAAPEIPLLILAALLFFATLAGAPFKAAEPALIADIFRDHRYLPALGLRTATYQSSQLVGFAVGGVAVAAAGSRTALAIDAATFAVSAVVLRYGLRPRPAARAHRPTGHQPASSELLGGIRLVGADRRLRLLLGLAWLAGLWVVPEGLAAPYAAEVGAGAAGVGWLLAANPAGNVVGALLLSRWVPPALRPRLLGPLAVVAGLPLMACAFRPGLLVTVFLWAVAGVCSAYQVQLIAEYMALAPTARRGQAVGLASAGLLAAQGIGLLAGGALARSLGGCPDDCGRRGGRNTPRLMAGPQSGARRLPRHRVENIRPLLTSPGCVAVASPLTSSRVVACAARPCPRVRPLLTSPSCVAVASPLTSSRVVACAARPCPRDRPFAHISQLRRSRIAAHLQSRRGLCVPPMSSGPVVPHISQLRRSRIATHLQPRRRKLPLVKDPPICVSMSPHRVRFDPMVYRSGVHSAANVWYCHDGHGRSGQR